MIIQAGAWSIGGGRKPALVLAGYQGMIWGQQLGMVVSPAAVPKRVLNPFRTSPCTVLQVAGLEVGWGQQLGITPIRSTS